MPPDMPAAKLRPVLPSTTTMPPVMYSQQWSPAPSITAIGAGIAHGEALAGDAAEIAFALDRAVQHGVADDDRFLRHDADCRRRPDDDAPARQALADIVVGIAFELEGDAAREPGAEALPGGAGEAHVDGVVRQAVMAVALGDLARQHAAGGAVGVADRRSAAAPARRDRARPATARSACGRGCRRSCGPAART